MSTASLSPIVSFPVGFQDAVPIDLGLLCATASEAALTIQQENFEGLQHIFEHVAIPPALRGEATRQIGVAFSMSRLFGRGNHFLHAIDPAPETVEKLALHFERTCQHPPSNAHMATMAPSYIHEAERMREQGLLASIPSYLDRAIQHAIRAGDVVAALSCLTLAGEYNVEPKDALIKIHFAEHTARLGLLVQASRYMAGVFSLMRKSSPNETDMFLIASAKSYLRIGALKGAEILIDTVQDEEMRFLMLFEKADTLIKFHQTEEARSCLLGECLERARSVEDRESRIMRHEAIIDALIEYGWKADAAAILDEITDHLSNRSTEDHEHLAWAAQAMTHLEYPVVHIVGMLTEGWLHDDHPDFQDDPTGLARRQSQAHLVRERWQGRLDHIAEELLTA
jgi:hypothetical protein